jgi:DNA-binding NtrC family response regulator
MRFSLQLPAKKGLNEGSCRLAWLLQYQQSAMKKLHNKCILVIDDDDRWLRALDKVLTGEGAVVTGARWAGDVLDILTARKIQFDLLITDLRMPFVSGLTMVYSVRKMFPALPIIVLTAFGSPYVKAECLSQGAAAFLEKPLDTTALLGVIEGVFASHPNRLEETWGKHETA